MRRLAHQLLLSLLAGTMLLSGCGAGAAPTGAQPSQARTSDDEGAAPRPSTDDDVTEAPLRQGQGRLAEEPVYLDELDEAPEGWPGTAGADGYPLPAGETVDVPYSAPASALGSMLAVGVTMPVGSATTITCDLGATGTVSLELRAEGAWTVTLVTGGTGTELDAGTLDPGQRGEPGEPTALRMACSDSPDGLAVGVSLHGGDIGFVPGLGGAVPAGGPTWQVSSTGAAGTAPDVVLDSVYVYLVEA